MAGDSRKQRNEQLSRKSQAAIQFGSGNNRLSSTLVQRMAIYRIVKYNSYKRQLQVLKAGTVRPIPSLS